MKYFALIDFVYVEYIGDFSHFDAAAEQAERDNPYASVTAIWSEESLLEVKSNIEDALLRARS